jgi:small subunit ribosomal protein S9
MDLINAIGRRKTSFARLYLKPGTGQFSVNENTPEDYFPSEIHNIIVRQPLSLLDLNGKFDLRINVAGGGFKGQAEAIRLAIARALCDVDPAYRTVLKKEGFLTRDPRMVERKKYGKRKARRRFQFSKR